MSSSANLASLISGKLPDGYYLIRQNGKTFVKKNPRKRKPEELSEDQKLRQAKFAGLSKFTSNNLNCLIHPIWNTYKIKSNSGYHSFIKANKPAFAMDGSILDYSILMASIGVLPMPFNLSAEKLDDNPYFKITWDYEYSGLHLSLFDFFCYAVFNERNQLIPYFTSIYRKDKEAIVNLSENLKDGDFIYVFFSSRDRSQFSNSLSIKIR